MGFSLLEILMPTNIPPFNPNIGRVHRQFEKPKDTLPPAPPVIPEGHKKCAICRKIKPYEQYHMEHGNRDGRVGTCKVCVSARRKQYLARLGRKK